MGIPKKWIVYNGKSPIYIYIPWKKNKDETISPYPHHMFYYYQHLDPPSILKHGVLTHNLSSMFEGYFLEILEGLGVCIIYMHHVFIYWLQEVYACSFETRLHIFCVVVVAATIIGCRPQKWFILKCIIILILLISSGWFQPNKRW